MFICPNCQSRLARTQNQLGIYWTCPGCGGRAVGLAVLRKAATPEFVNRVWALARDGNGTLGRRCPMCDKAMLEVTLPQTALLKLDVCKRCDFVWFDPNELETVPPAPPKQQKPDDEKDLPQAAREALAIEKVRQMGEQARAEDPSPDEDWKTIPAIFGLPVESETEPLSHWPWLTWTLAALIALVSIFAFTNLNEAVSKFGLVPAEAWRYGGTTLLTSFFLHGGWWHLISNLYFLLIFGDNVEDFIGRKRFFALVFLATVAGDFFHILGEPHSTTPCIGASGGISAVIAFYALKFPHARLGFLMSRYWQYSWVQLPAWGAFALWVAMQFFGAYKQTAGFGEVSAFAHLGGAAVGILAWVAWRKIELQPATPLATDANA